VKSSTPTFRQMEASDHVIHGANISENGFDPTGNNPPNRNLADYFQVAFDPTGAAVIGYCDDHNDLSGHTFVTRQTSGPGATGANIPTPVEGSALPPSPNEPLPRAVDVSGIPGSQVTDFKDDVRIGGNPELGGTAVLPVDDQCSPAGRSCPDRSGIDSRRSTRECVHHRGLWGERQQQGRYGSAWNPIPGFGWPIDSLWSVGPDANSHGNTDSVTQRHSHANSYDNTAGYGKHIRQYFLLFESERQPSAGCDADPDWD
jgi:hypothetical protein